MLSRRGFIKYAGIAAGTILVAPGILLAETRPLVLYGDGQHDDTEALQAWIDGQSVTRPDGTVFDGQSLSAGQYRINQAIHLRGSSRSEITGCHFQCDGPLAVNVGKDNHVWFRGNVIKGNYWG